MKLKELSDTTGIAERQIRFMIAEGFLHSPRGGRAHADYGNDHKDVILRYSRLKELGFPPAAIRLLLDAREGVPIPVVPGITLVVAPNLMGSGMAVAPLVEMVETKLSTALGGPAE